MRNTGLRNIWRPRCSRRSLGKFRVLGHSSARSPSVATRFTLRKSHSQSSYILKGVLEIGLRHHIAFLPEVLGLGEDGRLPNPQRATTTKPGTSEPRAHLIQKTAQRETLSNRCKLDSGAGPGAGCSAKLMIWVWSISVPLGVIAFVQRWNSLVRTMSPKCSSASSSFKS